MMHRKTEKPKEEKQGEHKNELEELRQQVENLQKEKDDLFGKLQRVSADYANFQKRVPKQVADTIAYEKEKIIRTLLPALDNFEHTFQNLDSAENVDAVVKGVRIIYDQMLDILKSHGVEPIDALGEKFDPSMHEAVLRKAELNEPDNIVLEEFRKGYKLNGRVIRPSKAVVNKLLVQEAAEQEHAEKEPEEQELDSEKQAADETPTDQGQSESRQTTDTE